MTSVSSRHALALLCVALTASSPAIAQRVQKDIAYIASPTAALPAATGDLYLPAALTSTAASPVIVFLHGGSWRSGDKGEFDKLGRSLAAAGYVGFSINYDLDKDSFPISWNQARAAVEFVRAHAAAYRIDPQKIVIAGTSAGGEIAALIALAPGGPASNATHAAIPVAAAIMLNSVYDLHGNYSVIHRYLGGKCNTAGAACDDSSPENHVHADVPPFFIGHGTHDHVVPYSEAVRMTDNLRRAGDFVATYNAVGGPHMYWEKSKFYDANLAAMLEFLHRVAPVAAAAATP